MIGLLILVQVLDVVGGDVASPLHVEVLVVAFDHVEAGVLAGVDHSVVDVSGVTDLEGHEEVLDLVSIVLTNTVSCPIEVDVAWVGEEGSRWPA